MIGGFVVSHALLSTLSDICGPDAVASDDRTLHRYRRDAYNASRGALPIPDTLPLTVVRPSSREQVQEIVRLANRQRFALIPYGGGTGLMGGALTIGPAVVLDLARLNRVLDVNPDDRTATAQSGVVLRDLENALNAHGMILGHDPWTVPVATVGGTISTNSLGYRGARYGSMGDQVLGLEAVLPDGSLLTTRASARSSTGPDLKRLLIGGEGCFGVVTAATLRTFPVPETRALYAYRFPDFPAAWRAVDALFRMGVRPAMVDMGDGYEGDDDEQWEGEAVNLATLYLAFEGFREEVAAQVARALPVLTEHRGRPRIEQEAVSFWEGRHAIAERFKERRERGEDNRWGGPNEATDYLHVSLPASQVLPVRERALELVRQAGAQVRESGLWNQPELYSLALGMTRNTGEEAAAELARLMDTLLRLVQDAGGSMEYCHGVGVRLAALMEREHGHGLETLRTLKRTLDPNGVMNPGKLGLTP
ncbi:MAG: FAD-binding oxidoreductase [Chloroflexi bacterium]|nr:FAD-binding oxidoreductase [Chloroflexota bacterium]